MTEEQVLTYARSVWPKGFTQDELAQAIGDRVDRRMIRKLVEDTGVRRLPAPPAKRKRIVWRFKPHQLPLPLGDR